MNGSIDYEGDFICSVCLVYFVCAFCSAVTYFVALSPNSSAASVDSLLLSLWLHFPVCSVDMERERQKEHYVGATLRRTGDCFEGMLTRLGR